MSLPFVALACQLTRVGDAGDMGRRGRVCDVEQEARLGREGGGRAGGRQHLQA